MRIGMSTETNIPLKCRFGDNCVSIANLPSLHTCSGPHFLLFSNL